MTARRMGAEITDVDIPETLDFIADVIAGLQ
jgi:hypothetical protein